MSSLDAISVNVEAETGNVRPLLHEIRHALKRLANGEDGTVIDLRRLPLAPGEEERLDTLLGKGEVHAQVDALGMARVRFLSKRLIKVIILGKRGRHTCPNTACAWMT